MEPLQQTTSPLEPRVGCIAAALSILGQKWTALIIRDLYTAPRRFGELESLVGGITPRTLSQRLDSLQKSQIVVRRGHIFSLTPKGCDLVPILEQMAHWGNKYQVPCE